MYETVEENITTDTASDAEESQAKDKQKSSEAKNQVIEEGIRSSDDEADVK